MDSPPPAPGPAPQKEKPLPLIMDSPPPAPGPAPPPPPPPHHLPAEQHRNWLDLSRELMKSILKRLLTSAQNPAPAPPPPPHHLPAEQYKNWLDPSKRTLKILTMDQYWAGYDQYRAGYNFDDMCRHAVNLMSCGQLVGVKVGCMCTGDLLKYITERTSELRYLGLLRCGEIPDKGFSEAAANIPLLKELELSFCTRAPNILEAFGRSCPHLKSLKVKTEVYWGIDIFSYLSNFKGCDLSAVAIAENMPGLVNLLLVGNNLTNDGLQAILDGCPDLQSLELWRCRFVSMEGDFGRKCSERIKSLRFHYCSAQEFEKLYFDGDCCDDYIDDDDDYFGLEYI